MLDRLRAFADDDQFRGFILGLIVFNALCMSLDATPDFAALYADRLYWIFTVSQIIFVIEISVRLLAHLPHPGRFFRDFWNCFDFAIVLVSFVPAVGSFALIARLLRVLRVLRVLSLSRTLRELFDSRLSVSKTLLVYSVLVALTLYIFAISGYYILSDIAPSDWGSFKYSLVSLSNLLVLHDLSGLTRPVLDTSVYLAAYFALFYLTVAGLVLNLIRTLLLAGPRETGDESE